MGKAAGLWKKVKTVAKTIGGDFGRALSWANENLIRKNKKYIDFGLDMIDPTGTARRVKDAVSNGITFVSDKLGYNPDTTWGDRISNVVDDVVINTQPYHNPFENATKINDVGRINQVKGPGGLRPTKGYTTDVDGSTWDSF